MKKKYPISNKVRADLNKVENRLTESLRQAPELLNESISKVLNAGGKRLRPLLVILAALTGDETNDKTIDGAVAVELIHLASLIHDDILDGALTRRGYPTINSVHGHNLAAAAGDFLFGLSFQILSSFDDNELLEPLSKASMSLSLGEILERDMTGKLDQSIKDYLIRVDRKTASLFEAACLIGSRTSHGSRESGELLASYGYNLGMAFQIYDDILDITGDESDLGKPVGNDLKEGVITLPILLALEFDDMGLIEQSVNNPATDNIKKAIEFVVDGEAIPGAKKMAKEFIDQAIKSIDTLESRKIKKELISISEFVINRYH